MMLIQVSKGMKGPELPWSRHPALILASLDAVMNALIAVVMSFRHCGMTFFLVLLVGLLGSETLA